MQYSNTLKIYVEQVVSSVVRIASKQLFQFSRVIVPARATRTVTMLLNVSDLALYDDEAGAYVVEPGQYVVYAGYNGCDGIETEGLRQDVFIAATTDLMATRNVP